MKDEAIHVSPEEYDAANGDPMQIPRLREAIGVVEEQAAAEFDEMVEPADRPDLTDIKPEFSIAGQPCRGMSAGVLMVLEAIDHPLVGDGWENPTVSEIMYLMFALAYPDLAEVVELAETGKLKGAAAVWAFDISPADMQAAEEGIQRFVDSIAAQLPDDDKDTNAKKKNG